MCRMGWNPKNKYEITLNVILFLQKLLLTFCITTYTYIYIFFLTQINSNYSLLFVKDKWEHLYKKIQMLAILE